MQMQHWKGLNIPLENKSRVKKDLDHLERYNRNNRLKFSENIFKILYLEKVMKRWVGIIAVFKYLKGGHKEG